MQDPIEVMFKEKPKEQMARRPKKPGLVGRILGKGKIVPVEDWDFPAIAGESNI